MNRRFLRMILRLPFPQAVCLLAFLLLCNLVGDLLIRASTMAIQNPLEFSIAVAISGVVGIGFFIGAVLKR